MEMVAQALLIALLRQAEFKVAHPDRAVVCITGDGGFLFTMPELATAVKHGIKLVTVLFNDGAFGNVRRIQKMQYQEHYIACDLANPDFMKLAEAFGVEYFRLASGPSDGPHETDLFAGIDA